MMNTRHRAGVSPNPLVIRAPTMCPALLALPSRRGTSLRSAGLRTGSGSGATGKASLRGHAVHMEEEEEPVEKSFAGTGQTPMCQARKEASVAEGAGGVGC